MVKDKHAPSSKYHVDVSSEFEPGSRKRVLKNLLHITSVRKMEDEELRAYMRAERLLIQRYNQDHSFTCEDLNAVHWVFLGKIYRWAGSYRTVNLSKGGFPFASALAIPSAMKEFETNTLRSNTPCRNPVVREAARMIAEVHV
jgi:cell filamentation protein